MTNVEEICARLRERLDEKNAVREYCFARSREVVRASANAIRHIHRQDPDGATALLDQARGLMRDIHERAAEYPDLFTSGYVQDAGKEFTEAACTHALVMDLPLPEPEALGVETGAWLNGLGEAIGELRRHILDRIREGDILLAEQKLQQADDIFHALALFDYPEPLTGGLRRTVDAMRSLLERTRGDVTNALRQLRLEEALRRHAGD